MSERNDIGAFMYDVLGCLGIGALVIWGLSWATGTDEALDEALTANPGYINLCLLVLVWLVGKSVQLAVDAVGSSVFEQGTVPPSAENHVPEAVNPDRVNPDRNEPVRSEPRSEYSHGDCVGPLPVCRYRREGNCYHPDPTPFCPFDDTESDGAPE